MWNNRWFIFAFNNLCESCKHYYQLLLAMGLAPTNLSSEESSLADCPETAPKVEAPAVMSLTEAEVLKGTLSGCRYAMSISAFGTLVHLDKR